MSGCIVSQNSPKLMVQQQTKSHSHKRRKGPQGKMRLQGKITLGNITLVLRVHGIQADSNTELLGKSTCSSVGVLSGAPYE